MRKAKFWVFQIAMVAIVSLVLGSPVLAHNDDFDDDAFNEDKWHQKFEKKFTKKFDKLYDKFLDEDIDEDKYDKKHAKLEAKYKKKMAKHMSKHHGSDTVSVSTPPAPDSTPCGTMDPVTFTVTPCA